MQTITLKRAVTIDINAYWKGADAEPMPRQARALRGVIITGDDAPTVPIAGAAVHFTVHAIHDSTQGWLAVGPFAREEQDPLMWPTADRVRLGEAPWEFTQGAGVTLAQGNIDAIQGGDA